MNSLWTVDKGRELDSTPLDETTNLSRMVACLNVWNDLVPLKRTIHSWYPHVHHVIAVDGSYSTTGSSLSTDGTREYLQRLPNVTLIDAAGLSQCEKRSQYFRATRAGDRLFIVDADEALISGSLHNIPTCDVGWVRIESSLYVRSYGQPRILTWRPGLEYRGRHHWIYELDRLVCTHQYGGTGYEHRTVNATLHNQRRTGRSVQRLLVKSHHHEKEVTHERSLCAIPQSIMSDSAVATRESLQIAMYAYRDDGLAPSRLHTAINRTTPHSSTFFKVRPGPFGVPDQYMVSAHAGKLATALASADIVHYHTMMSHAKSVRANAKMVFHHHGTVFRQNAPEYNQLARDRNALVVLSNLELFSHVDDDLTAYFLPNTVPVARYARLREIHQVPFGGQQLFRIAHSPSHPEKKGTDKLQKVVAHLQSTGLPIELVMIHGLPHKDSLRLKATCHASFDSLWLGMQCSGIETAAMGLPTIAGDEQVRARYVEHFGFCPYTFANDEEAIEYEIRSLVLDDAYYAEEAERVFHYVRDFHDESAVALKYLDLLDLKFGWRLNPLHVTPKVSARVRR